MKPCVIFGTTNFGKMMRYYLEEYAGVQVEAYILDKEYIQSGLFDNLPVLPFEKCKELFPPEFYTMLLALGYKKMNQPREQKFWEAKARGYEIQSFVHPSAVISSNAKLGEGNIILEQSVIAYGVTIGRGNIIWNGCNLSHESTIGDFNYFSPGVILGGETIVRSRCFFGLNASVRGANTVEDRSLIGAGAFVNKGTESGGVYVPARTVKLEGKTSDNFF